MIERIDRRLADYDDLSLGWLLEGRNPAVIYLGIHARNGDYLGEVDEVWRDQRDILRAVLPPDAYVFQYFAERKARGNA